VFLKEFHALGGNCLFSDPFPPIGTYVIVGLTLMSPFNIVDRLIVIPWQHDTHDKVWDMTTITSLRKVKVEEKVEEKVEVEMEL
jgi:hypothetical protein